MFIIRLSRLPFSGDFQLRNVMYMSDEKKPFTDVLKDGALKPLFNSQGNTRGRVTFSIILQTGGLHLIKKTIPEFF